MSEQESVKEVSHDRKSPCGVTFETDEKTFSGASTHFSEKGILVLCNEPAPLSVKGKIRLRFPGYKNPIDLSGDVVWTNIHGAGDSLCPRGMGIKFVNVDRETERTLSELSAQYDSLGSIYACYYT